MSGIFAPVVDGEGLSRSGISWGWMVALGLLMALLGLVGLGMAFWLTLVSIFWFGVFAVVGGIAQIIDSLIHHKGWQARIWQALIGVLYMAAGAVMILTPLSAAFWLTVILASSLIAVAISRFVMAVQMRGQGKMGLVLLVSALLSLLLGVLIFSAVVPSADVTLATAEGQAQWLRSWGWIIGLTVAVELITEGISLILLGISAKPSVR